MENYLEKLTPLGKLFFTQMMMRNLRASTISINRIMISTEKVLLRSWVSANLMIPTNKNRILNSLFRKVQSSMKIILPIIGPKLEAHTVLIEWRKNLKSLNFTKKEKTMHLSADIWTFHKRILSDGVKME